MDLWGGTNGFTPALSGSTLRVKKTGETGSQYVSFCRSIRALLSFNMCRFDGVGWRWWRCFFCFLKINHK